ncbi:MAG: amino acid ABC transporter ATP-binding protein [Alphaproteobacteria bacterium]|nr:amino acid ABC transporter ATP-binding protein [Alphaproteobacteria bacterium]MBV8548765.1 amino acid ABC transporter ATP-binding protein [Alphaproteobacteria bacterium]
MLQADNIHFGYGDRKILNGVSLSVPTGGVTVLIGPSGTGKTTLLRCLALLEKPQSGTLTVDGQTYAYPLSGPMPPAPWPKLTAVFQQLFLWPHLTLCDNILMPAERRGMAGLEAELAALIDAFDMGDFIHRYPNEASLGQRQRAALARALILKPSYLLLDEITSALDVEQIAKILDYLKNLRGQSIGIFIITHLLGFARHAADQVVFMANGEVVESGTSDILRNPQTERLFQFLSVIAAAS